MTTRVCAGWQAARLRQRGFTFVEMAVVMVVVGLMSWASFSAYEAFGEQQRRNRAQAVAQEMQAHLRSFALRNARLPCPDASTAGTGYEAGGSGCAALPNQRIGWFPYVTVGMALPETAARARFGVFRAAAGADLAVAAERTGDAPGQPNFTDVGDLGAGLNTVASAAFDNAQPYLTGDGGAAGAVDCANNTVVNVAYWIVLPLQDRDGDGNALDAPHTAASPCIQSSTAPVRAGNDDVVLSESALQLAGWLRRSLP